MADNKKIEFIICSNNDIYLAECCRYLELLNVPDGFETEVQVIEGAASMTSGYNYGMSLSDAKYRVYLHQDVFIINRNFIFDLLNIFKDETVGMAGIVGAPKLPESCVMWEAPRIGAMYANTIYTSLDSRFSNQLFGADGSKPYYPVECVDGMLIATQYDIPWREDLFDGWDFYDISESFEFRKAGYKVVVPAPATPWVIHDDGMQNLTRYEKYRDIFKENYIKQ